MDQKTDAAGFYKRDNRYLINKDNDALDAYRKRKAQNIKIKNLEDNLKSLKEDISEIKHLLTKMVK